MAAVGRSRLVVVHRDRRPCLHAGAARREGSRALLRSDHRQEIWSHEDAGPLRELVAGAGPRATPTFHAGKLYALGGSGKLNCLDAATGKPLWSHDIVKDAGLKAPPPWGFSSSPLVAQGIVMVFAGGDAEKIDESKVQQGEQPAAAPAAKAEVKAPQGDAGL